jgi:hypothetical protein
MKRAGDWRQRIRLPEEAAHLIENRYAVRWGMLTREGRNMARMARRRTAAALALAATVIGMGATRALAQDYSGSTVTTGGATAGVEAGDVLTVPPGVTIDTGNVSNATGIGVVIGGGTSAGSAPGGGTNAAAPD